MKLLISAIWALALFAQNNAQAQNTPYYGVITCGMMGRHIAMMHCLEEYGSLEIKNGSEYGLYKFKDLVYTGIPNAKEGKEGLKINLRSNFSITARNHTETDMVLGIKIYERSSNKILYEKKVSNMGIIKVTN
jgi:hypothetical protein